MIQPILYILVTPLLIFYFIGPLALLWLQSAFAIFWITYGVLGLQVIAGSTWLITLFIELVFADEGVKSGGLSTATQRSFALMFFIAFISVAIPIVIGFLIHSEKIPKGLRSWVLIVSAIFPLLTMVPEHPALSLIKEFWHGASSLVKSREYRETEAKALKQNAERLRNEFEAGQKQLACEWFANDPIAPSEKFAACRELVESLPKADERWQQLQFFRPKRSQFAIWYKDQKNFSSEIRDWSSATPVIPANEHAWLMRTVLSTFQNVSDPVFRAEYANIRLALNDLLENLSGAQWSPEIQQEFAKFPKEVLIARAEKLAQEFPGDSEQVSLFVKTLKGEKIFSK